MTRTVLIAGSSRGIGAAAARLESASGSHVILHGRTESEGLTKLAADLDAPASVATDKTRTPSRRWSVRSRTADTSPTR